jgi:hypothetical protein
MLEPFRVGLEPQSLHYHNFDAQHSLMLFFQFPKSDPIVAVVAAWWWRIYVDVQHMNNVNHIAHVWRGCCYHSMWVWSLNHSIIIIFIITFEAWVVLTDDFSWFLKSEPMIALVWPWWTSAAYEWCESHCICLERMLQPFHVGLEPQSSITPLSSCLTHSTNWWF